MPPYIQSWLKVLEQDKRAIFAAAAHAQREKAGGMMEEFYFLEEKIETEFSDDVLVHARIISGEDNSLITVEYHIADRAGRQDILEQSISIKCVDDIYITKFDPT